jgi:Ycf66 protein N-terminus
MLAYILAVLVGTGSVGLYISAFFFPEIHRKQDFIWSGVGFFYALVLWIYARQETGGILVGQVASVSLLGWFAWQTLKLRRQLVPINQQTPIPTKTKLKEQLGLKQPTPKTVMSTTPAKPVNQTAKLPVKTSPIRPSAAQEQAAVEIRDTKPVRQVSQPISPDPVVEEEAWIELIVKPVSAPVPSLETKVQPSTKNNSELDRSPAVVPEIVSEKIPTDPTQSISELGTENWD